MLFLKVSSYQNLEEYIPDNKYMLSMRESVDVQAYLRNIAELAPDHCNTAIIAIKQVS